MIQEEKLRPCTLEGKIIRLEPLRPKHAQPLVEAGRGFDWAWLSRDLSTLESVKAWISEAMKAQRLGQECPFVVFHKEQGRIVGSTRYLDIHPHAMGLEIGWTWYSPNVWGTRVNPEAKLLLLQHAFEDWGAIRVQLKTDHENKHSQNAIKKLGAKFEGKLRNHMIRRDKTIRHSMMYSITREDWPVVRAKLRERLEHSKDLPELSLDESRYF